MISLSASQTPRARACPPSIRTDAIQVVTGELPAVGQAAHHGLNRGIAHGQHLEVATLAAMFGADEEELERVMIQAWRAWSAIRQWFGDQPQCEVLLEHEFGPLHLSGHVDVLGLAPMQRQVRIADWKSSWQSEDHSDQIRAYAWLALQTYPDYDEVWAAVIRPRQGTYDAQVYRREDLKLWMDGLIERLTGRGSEQFNVGEQCLRCPRSVSCPAIADLMRRADTTLDIDDSLGNGPERYEEIYTKLRILEQACEVTRKAIKSQVAAAGGRIGNLVVTEEARETIRYTEAAAARVFAALGNDDLERIVSISKTELGKVVMRDAPHGQKGAKWQAIQEVLREAGAVDKTFITKLELRRSQCRRNNPRSS